MMDEKYLSIINILIKNKTWNEKLEIFNSFDLSLDDKINFCLYVTLEDNIKFSPVIVYEFIPFIFNQLMTDNSREVIKLIVESRFAEIIDCFKRNNFIANVIISNDNVIRSLMREDKFKDCILKNMDIVLKFQNHFSFFNNLPDDYGYLISLYNSDRDNDISKLEELYQKYYHQILNKSEFDELVKIQRNLNIQDDIFELGLKNRIKEFYYFMYNVYKDNNYYNKIKSLSIKTDIDFINIINFAFKYDSTNLFFNILNKDIISSELREKILYCSFDNKLIDDIDDLDNFSLIELKKLPKEKIYDIKTKLIGGPHSKTNENIFNDGSSREIRRIDKDGNVTIYKMNLLENHEDAVKKIYNDLVFDKNNKTAVERAVDAIKQISSITMVIEREMCILYLEDVISVEQKDTLINMFLKINGKSSIGIILYDRKSDLYVIANNGKFLNHVEIIDFIKNMDISNVKLK